MTVAQPPTTGESVVFATRLHPVVLSGAVSFALSVTGVVTLIVVRNDLAHAAVVQLWLAGLAVAASGFVAPVVRWRRSALVVTDRRLLVRLGLVRLHALDLSHDTVDAVEAGSTLVGRLLDYGSVRILGTDGTDEEVPRVAHAEAFRAAAESEARGSGRRGTRR